MNQCVTGKNHNDVSIKDYTSKTRMNYLLLRNLDIPSTIKEKKEAVLKHRQLMKNELNALKKLSIQSLIHSVCKLVASVMIASDSRKSKLRMHCKNT